MEKDLGCVRTLFEQLHRSLCLATVTMLNLTSVLAFSSKCPQMSHVFLFFQVRHDFASIHTPTFATQIIVFGLFHCDFFEANFQSGRWKYT